jgi:hypothetical protein
MSGFSDFTQPPGSLSIADDQYIAAYIDPAGWKNHSMHGRLKAHR